MRYVIRLVALVCLGLAGLGAGPANAERRVALVIGNAGYRTVAELPNPKKDARDIAAALRAAGFTEVVERYDLGLREMQQVLSQFEDKVAGADWGVAYYAGHGIEVDGRNFLVPVDADLKRAGDVEDETVALDRVLARVAAASKLQLVILDACRENPFKRRMAQAGGVKRAIGERGLARIEPAHPNVIVAYAARDGEVALDGRAGENSPYAGALMRHLAEPGLELGRLFRKVRVDVLAATGGRQRPFEYGSLTEDLFFKPGAAADPKPVVVPQLSEAERAWAAVKDTTSIAALEAFRRQYGAANPVYDRLAEARIEELRKQQIALAVPPTPKPAPAPVVEPSVGVFTPGPGVTPLSAERELALKAKDRFKECDACPEMVVVPAGSFMMGSPAGEARRDAYEGPQHPVTIARQFAVGKFEVTFTEWDACVAAGGCKHNPGDSRWGRGKRPVINVSWDDAKEYVAWLSRKTGKTYRLLTEAEWEYAARAGTTTPFSTGPTITTSQANFHGNYTYPGSGKGVYRAKTVDVGSFPPNAFGLHDMHGNVWEWVQDCWNASYSGAPSDGSAWTTGNCSRWVLRGGSWYDDPRYLRSAARFRDTPVRDYFAGFRVGRTL